MSYPAGVITAPFLEGTTPVISDSWICTFIAGGTITMGQLVSITANWTVSTTTAKNDKTCIGIALTNGVTGGPVSVVLRGICRVVPFSSMNAGDQFTSSGGTAITDNSSLNTTVLGSVIAGGNSAGTAVVFLWG